MKILFIKTLFIISVSIVSFTCFGQKVQNPAFEKKIDQLIKYDIPVVTVENAQENYSDYIFLDARELEEFTISHIPNALHIGYDDFEIEKIPDLSKDQKLIVYCSIGYRSEKIGNKLKKAGFNNVYNLYGSIFEWANRGYSIEDIDGHSTRKLHTYNKKWSKWVDHPNIIKTW